MRVYVYTWEKVRKMAEIIEYIPELKGVDAEIFLHKLEEDISSDEIEEVREWALGTRSTIQSF